MVSDPTPPLCCGRRQMVGTDMTFLDIIGGFLTLQEARGIRQPLGREEGEEEEEEASLSLCFEQKKGEKAEWNRPAGCSVMCGREGEGSFVPSER